MTFLVEVPNQLQFNGYLNYSIKNVISRFHDVIPCAILEYVNPIGRNLMEFIEFHCRNFRSSCGEVVGMRCSQCSRIFPEQCLYKGGTCIYICIYIYIFFVICFTDT